MEKMPYRAELDGGIFQMGVPGHRAGHDHGLAPGAAGADGRSGRAPRAARERCRSLFAMLTTEEVSRFISPPPSTVEGFERFIAWTQRQRAAGTYVCFAVTVKGSDTAIGIFQVRELEPDFRTAEWGFAIGSPFWGTGVFVEGASLTIDFAFDALGVHRLEARAAVRNGRGNAALPRSAPCRKACCGSRSCATASISTRCSTPSSRTTGERATRSSGTQPRFARRFTETGATVSGRRVPSGPVAHMRRGSSLRHTAACLRDAAVSHFRGRRPPRSVSRRNRTAAGRSTTRSTNRDTGARREAGVLQGEQVVAGGDPRPAIRDDVIRRDAVELAP